AKRCLVRIAYLRDLLSCPPDVSPLPLFIGFVSDLPEPSSMRVAAAETVVFIGYVSHGQVEAWCARTLRRLLFINAHTRLVTGLAVDGRWLYTTSADEQLRVWNLTKAFPNWSASSTGGTMYSLYKEGLELKQGRPQSPQIGIRCDLDDLSTGFHLLRKRVITAHVLSQGQLVLFYLDRNVAAYWSVSEHSAEVTGHAELFDPSEAEDVRIGKVRIIPSHSYAAYLVHSSSWERPQIRIFHMIKRRQICTLRHSGNRVRATRRLVIVRSDNATGGCDCHLYDIASLAYLRSVRIDKTPVHLIFTPDSRHAIGVNPRIFISVWSLEEQPEATNGAVEAVSVAKPLGLNLKVLTRKESVVFTGESLAIFGLVYGSICLWKPADVEFAVPEMSRLEARQRVESEGSVLRFHHVTIIKSAHEHEIVALKVNRTGDAFASCGLDSLLKIWSLKDYSCLQVLAGHTDLIRCCHFTDLASPVISGSRDQTLRVWRSGRESAKFVAHTDVFFVRSTNGAVVALFSYDLKRRLAIFRMPQTEADAS
uniref:WD_REPEATS_REGION domain-containing protein n=1 Tax=Macrostomum lignano TaxID=282301 RepID=A0A1I8HXD9_9PLAT